MAPLIGIDLGTTHSLCSVFQDGKSVLIPNAQGQWLTPSVVGFTEKGEALVGTAAKELQVVKPEQCASNFKRLMGQNDQLQLGGKPFSPPELSSMVLRSLKADAEALLGQEITEAVITVPAYFNEHQRRATQLAGELAGLDVKRMINEPTAAALAYGMNEDQEEKTLLIFDLGGGTFDVTLMEVAEGAMEIMATAGESFLGGENFTQRIASLALAELGLNFELAEMEHPQMLARLMHFSETAKRALTQNPSASFTLPQSDGTLGEDEKTFRVDQEAFANACKPLLDRLERPLLRALRDAQLSPNDIDEIILVGGATRMPLIHTFIQKTFGQDLKCTLNPDEVVALGASVQAALILDDKAVEDKVMTDVCPHTLGIEVVKTRGKSMQEGYFMPILHRNTTIPVSCEEDVYTISNNQKELLIEVYQGESRKVEQNTLLGQLRVLDLPPHPAGLQVFVRFTYDINGLLEVEALIPKTGKKHQAVINHTNQKLNEAEIKKAVKNMQALKFYPRDDLKNRNLALFAERVVGEVGRYDRERLEQALDYYEQSLNSNDRNMFETARQELIIALSDLGFPYHEEADD